MRLAVCGGRNFKNWKLLEMTLNIVYKTYNIKCLIHGGATGADRMAGHWADQRNIPTLPIPADWKGNGRSAGPKRNSEIIRVGRPDLLIAFPGGKGTADMIKKAERAGIPIERVGSEWGMIL